MIPEFTGDYWFLSNFYPCQIKDPSGLTWPSAEHLFQGCKTHSRRDREAIRTAVSPSDAKQLGRRVRLRPDWEQVKKSIMLKVVLAKFEQNPDLAVLLDATYGEELVEGNDPLSRALADTPATLLTAEEPTGCPACGSDDYDTEAGPDSLPDYEHGLKRCQECGEEWV